MEEEFKKFVQKFDLNVKMIKLKYNHSLRVQKLCEEIAKSEKLSNKNIKIASTIGLLHDYGRFYQWKKYQTYNDIESIDHADYAVQKLFDNGEIKKYYQNEEDYKTIYEAIKNHNKYEVDKNVEFKTMCNIIRDADKLEIIEMYKKGELIAFNEGEISEKVKESFYNHTQVNNYDVNSKADALLRTICLIYNLNFKYSFKYVKENKILDGIFNKIENKEIIKPYFNEIKKYVERKAGE